MLPLDKTSDTVTNKIDLLFNKSFTENIQICLRQTGNHVLKTLYKLKNDAFKIPTETTILG